jgi:hypothetical protein
MNTEDREKRILAEVDRELQAALSIAPSADFEARVLRRVADDDAPARWSYGWLAAAALVVLATGLFFALNRTPVALDEAPPQMAERQPDVRLPAPAHKGPAYTADAPARKGPAYASASVGRGFTPRRAAEPEVIVPLNQMEAVRRLVRAVNEGRVTAPPERPEGLMPPPTELTVTPLVVEPIRMPAIEAARETALPPENRSPY